MFLEGGPVQVSGRFLARMRVRVSEIAGVVGVWSFGLATREVGWGCSGCTGCRDYKLSGVLGVRVCGFVSSGAGCWA